MFRVTFVEMFTVELLPKPFAAFVTCMPVGGAKEAEGIGEKTDWKLTIDVRDL